VRECVIVHTLFGKLLSRIMFTSPSTVAWLPADTHALVERLNRRIARWTNLDLESAEQLQVSNCASRALWCLRWAYKHRHRQTD
jgi:hypothetical protein